jgi:flavin-binding protein dodecin
MTRRAYTIANPISWLSGDWTKARAYKGTPDQSLTAATETKVQLNEKSYDYLGWFDISTNFRYTIGSSQANGQYLITAAVTFVATASNSKVYIFITKNGTRVAVAQGNIIGGGSDVTLTLTDIQELANGDYVDLWAYSQLATTIKASNTGTYLTLAKLP